jgi:hypothetical protein
MSTASIIVPDVTDQNAELISDIEQINASTDVQVLLSQIHECLTITVHALMKLGAIVRRLEVLEVDVSALRLPNMDYFRRIAHGSMLPEVFVSLAGTPMVLRRVSRLPMVDQREIADGGPVKVMLRGGDHLMVAVSDLTTKQIKQVFAADHIRSESQQVAWLVEFDSQKLLPDAERPVVMLDRRRNGIVVGDVFVSAGDLAQYLGDLSRKV